MYSSIQGQLSVNVYTINICAPAEIESLLLCVVNIHCYISTSGIWCCASANEYWEPFFSICHKSSRSGYM